MKPSDVALYLGKPYRPGGTGPDFFDCFGLFCVLQLEYFSVRVGFDPKYSSSALSIRRAFRDSDEFQRWERTQEPKHGNAVVMSKNHHHRDHIGIWLDIDGGRVIHAAREHGVMISDLQSLAMMGWSRQAFYRFRKG